MKRGRGNPQGLSSRHAAERWHEPEGTTRYPYYAAIRPVRDAYDPVPPQRVRFVIPQEAPCASFAATR